MNVFPRNWNRSNQIIQFLQKNKKNINVDLKSHVGKNLFLILCAIQDIPYHNV